MANPTNLGIMAMEGKKSLRIGLEELCSAMEDSSYEHEYYLDLKTGEIVFLSDIDGEELLVTPKLSWWSSVLWS